ncbi:MAG: hypothetical protein ACO1OT_09700 [Heyndrickxia sp.]
MDTKEDIKKDLPEFHQKVLSVIPTGKDDSITISYIINKLGLNGQARRKITLVLNDLIFKYGYPIGSSSDDNTRGVFLIDNEEDLQLACRTLNSRAMKVLQRHKQIIENYNNQYIKNNGSDRNGQVALF